jgi:hypothetical protein
VDPVSLGKVMGLGYALLGLVIGAFFALFSVLGAGLGAAFSQTSEPWMAAVFGVGAVIILPVLYGIFGFIGGILMAAVFNVGMRWAGGLQVDLG